LKGYFFSRSIDNRIWSVIFSADIGPTINKGYILNVQGKGCYVAPKDSDLIREQLLRKIEDGFNAAINAARIAKLPHEELQKLFEFTLEGSRYE